MSHQLIAFVASFCISMVACEMCKYRKFTPDHAGCKIRNLTCNIVNNQVTDEDKTLIVKLHNQYREKVALGTFNNSGKTWPSASDMREMKWDDELANLAQRRAETCKNLHDCIHCRKVDRFFFGQNIYTSLTSDFSREWEYMMKSNEEPKNSLFQVISADTWRVGCGKVIIEDENSDFKTLIVCNYGPEANLYDTYPYKHGNACSDCPLDTCCGDSCKGFRISSMYQGLCKSDGLLTCGLSSTVESPTSESTSRSTAEALKFPMCGLKSTKGPLMPESATATRLVFTTENFQLVICGLSTIRNSVTMESTPETSTDDFQFSLCRWPSTDESASSGLTPETNIECDCGPFGACRFKKEKQICTCNRGYAEKDGKCLKCDCGRLGACRFERGKKKCTCPPYYLEREGRCTTYPPFQPQQDYPATSWFNTHSENLRK